MPVYYTGSTLEQFQTLFSARQKVQGEDGGQGEVGRWGATFERSLIPLRRLTQPNSSL